MRHEGAVTIKPTGLTEEPSTAPVGITLNAGSDDSLFGFEIETVPTLLTEILTTYYSRSAACATGRFHRRLSSGADERLSTTTAKIEMVRIM
jgi:hypothetical protein